MMNNQINIARKSIRDFHCYSEKLKKFGLQVDYDSQLVVSVIGECRSNLTDDMKSTDELKSFFYGYQAGVERTNNDAFINLDMIVAMQSTLDLIERIYKLDIETTDHNYKHFLNCAKSTLTKQLARTEDKKADTK